MRINELRGIKKTAEYKAVRDAKLLPKLIQQLRDLGYQQYELGFGLYGVVYSRPQDDYVVKIFRKDDGYETYLKFIEKFKSSPYVPRIRGKVIKISNNYSVVRIEKLKPITDELYLKFIKIKYPRYDDPGDRDEFEKDYPGFIDLLAELRKLTNRNILMDLHKDNIMMRGNVPVITDPFA